MSVPGWKKIFIWAKPWMLLRLDVMDAADVEEVVLVVEGEQPFHLRGVHAAVGLDDVDDRQVEVGEDVDLHARQGQAAADEIPASATIR